MKHIVIFFVLLPLFSDAQEKSVRFKIKGTFKNAPAEIEWVYFGYSSDGQRKKDSAMLKDGKYRFKGAITEPVMGSVWAKYAPMPDGKLKPLIFKRDVADLFLEKGKIRVISMDSLANKIVKGSTIHKDFEKLNKSVESFNERLVALYKRLSEFKKDNDDANFKKTEKEIEAMITERKAVYEKFAKNNPSSGLVVYAIKQFAGWDIDPAKVEPLFDALPPEVQKWPSAIELKQKIEAAKKTAIGNDALDFIQNDTLGIPVSLSSFRGKYVLIDFWASWCGPCRVDNPNLVRAFQKYKDKGFHILGVSLDRPGQKERWMQAIHDDKLEWTQVSDLKFWGNEVVVLYGINAIPQNLLIDPLGKIVAKNLRGDELDKKLEEIIVQNKKAFSDR